MIELYVREYVRLESERASLNSQNPSDEETRGRLRGLQRKVRRREFELFVAEQAGEPARRHKATAVRLDWRKLKGSEFSRHSFSSVRAWLAAFRSPQARQGKKRSG